MTAMGLLHLTTFLQGGAGRTIVDLALGQRAAGHRVTVVTSLTGVPGYGNDAACLARLREAGVQVFEIDSTFQRDFTANLAVVRTLRDRLDIDGIALIHAHAGTPAVIALVLASRAPRRIPVVQTMHGWGTRKTPEQAARDLAVLGELDAVVTTSTASAKWLQTQGVPDRLLKTIPRGLEATPPAGDPAERFPDVAAAREAGTAIVACLGTVSAENNQLQLVEALPAIGERLDRALLCVFAGDGPLVAELQARAGELGVAERCWFLGYQPSAAALIALADLLVLPARAGGQSMAVLEAFRAGVPAVVSDVPALLEQVLDGTTGYVVRGDTPAALADRVVRALDATTEERDVITAQAHARFTSRFTTHAMIEAHADLYARVAAQARIERAPVVARAQRAG